MAVNIEMPKLSDTMTEGTLLRWHKKVGDRVEIGDIIAEVETDKATMEMEAFDEGVLTVIHVPAGGKALIGTVLGVLDGADTDIAPAAVASSPAAATATAATPSAATQVAATTAPVAHAAGERIKSSPLARKIAETLHVDLTQIAGSGPGGRIVRKDVESAAKSPAVFSAPLANSQSAAANALAAATKARVAASAAAAAPAPILPVSKEGDQIIELSSLRKIIASRLLTSKQTIPHFYLHVEADAGQLMNLRKQINDQAAGTTGNKYSVNDFIMKALINATMAVPAINSSFAGDHIVRYGSVGLSVAIAIEDGLVTPVVKNAETKSLLQISREVKDFAVRAKDRKLRPDEFDGGTITISNLGAWGIESFDAIVNPPQAAILSVGAVIEKPVVKNGQIVIGQQINLGLSCDHRVVDGAIAAAFLSEVKKLIESPALMLV
jgi:pyruvate dehydrogenase E2 component (dihydrolipoamide acetyltransferase)